MQYRNIISLIKREHAITDKSLKIFKFQARHWENKSVKCVPKIFRTISIINFNSFVNQDEKNRNKYAPKYATKLYSVNNK